MKRYRLTERYVTLDGRTFEPQELLLHNKMENMYKATSDMGCVTFCPETMISAGYKGIEEIKPERWRTKSPGVYCFMNSDGTICIDNDFRFEADNGRHNIGNYFQTEAQAREASNRIKKVLEEYQEELLNN